MRSGVSKALLIRATSCLRSSGRRVLGSPCSLRVACHHLVVAPAAQKRLQRIIAETRLQQPREALVESQRLLPRAEALQKGGCSTREAWGRASAEFPELKAGRELVDIYLIWKTSTGNLERRFRTYSEVMTVQRSSLFDTTAETMMLADQAPPSGRLRALLHSETAAPAATDTSGHKKRDYLPELQLWHGELHPATRERGANGKQRRDAGVPRAPVAASAAPATEAAFGRQREAAIAAASPRKARTHGARDDLGPAGW